MAEFRTQWCDGNECGGSGCGGSMCTSLLVGHTHLFMKLWHCNCWKFSGTNWDTIIVKRPTMFV